MRSNTSIIFRAMLLVSAAITFSMMSLSFLVETSIKSHFLELDEEIINNKAAIINTFSKDKDALSKIITWDTTNADISFHVKILKNNKKIYESNHENFTSKKHNDIPVDVSEAENFSPYNYISRQIDFDINGMPFSVMISLDSSVHAHFLSKLRVQLLTILFGIWGIIILSTYLGIKKGHRSIYALSKHMSTIQAEKLGSTLDSEQYPSELRELVGSFNSMLAKLNHSFIKLSDFSDDVAHELRTPLTNIIMQAQVGLSQERTVAEYQDLMYSILEELEHLAKMIGDMLWIARSDNGLISASKELLNLEDEFLSILDFFQYLAEEKQLTFKIINQKSTVFVDKTMFRRAISNIISNAIKYSEGHSVIQILLSDNEFHDTVIAVTNECKGISYENSIKMFDRLYRADLSRSNSSEGVGLGLSIVKSIAEVNGGKVWNKVNGDYISFYLLFPAKSKL
ncbi:heavy metal sensor histidine kinase [Aeromonas enteropelogenes]|uniref:heavy metal sensor histidine kinase n=1 Tax=Aeromonas enteropelogenes TaxID=29489 RepID=UPI003BA2EC39